MQNSRVKWRRSFARRTAYDFNSTTSDYSSHLRESAVGITQTNSLLSEIHQVRARGKEGAGCGQTRGMKVTATDGTGAGAAAIMWEKGALPPRLRNWASTY